MGPVRINKEHSPLSDQGTTTLHENNNCVIWMSFCKSPDHTHTCIYLLLPPPTITPTPPHPLTYVCTPPSLPPSFSSHTLPNIHATSALARQSATFLLVPFQVVLMTFLWITLMNLKSSLCYCSTKVH